MKIRINKNVEVPKERAKSTTYPFEAMDIGDSFIAGEYSADKMSSISALISYYTKKDGSKKFIQRKTDSGYIRVWRTA